MRVVNRKKKKCADARLFWRVTFRLICVRLVESLVGNNNDYYYFDKYNYWFYDCADVTPAAHCPKEKREESSEQ